ncbi:MAG: hypothetical protein POELPBGB_03976 [Bacteroidia bacterium]|nr:hypothetical protein [Bacteroidia bacterium]
MFGPTARRRHEIHHPHQAHQLREIQRGENHPRARRAARTPGHHPERRSQGGHAGRRHLRRGAGNDGAAQDSRLGHPAGRGRQGRAGIAGRQAPAPQDGAGLMRFKVLLTEDAARGHFRARRLPSRIQRPRA